VKLLDFHQFDFDLEFERVIRRQLERNVEQPTFLLIDNLDAKCRYVEDGSDNYAHEHLESCKIGIRLCETIE
jgi:hypothetical protein